MITATNTNDFGGSNTTGANATTETSWAQATANGGTPHASSGITSQWQLSLVWMSDTTPPTTVNVNYTIDDWAGVSWSIDGYTPPDPNGWLDAGSSVGASAASTTEYQATSNNANLLVDDSGAVPQTQWAVSPTWQHFTGYWDNNPLNNFPNSSANPSAYADYSKPSHAGAGDFAYALAEETITLTSVAAA